MVKGMSKCSIILIEQSGNEINLDSADEICLFWAELRDYFGENKWPIEIINELDKFYGNLIATAYLEEKNYDRYKTFIETFNIISEMLNPPIPMKDMNILNPNPNRISLYDYTSQFHANSFKRQRELETIIERLLDIYSMDMGEKLDVDIPYYQEYQTGNGKCDFFIGGIVNTLLELKISRIKRSDLYQCFDYKLGNKKLKSRCVCIGKSIDNREIELADALGISVYTYHIEEIYPTRVIFKHISGFKFEIFEEINGIGMSLDPTCTMFSEILAKKYIQLGRSKSEIEATS